MTISGVLAALLWFGMAFAHAEEIKLFLEDGSYQLVKSYQVNGDRVHRLPNTTSIARNMRREPYISATLAPTMSKPATTSE